MASKKEYVYQIRGNQLLLAERDFTTADGLNYTYTSGAGLDIPSGSSVLKSPLSSESQGIELEYTYSPSSDEDIADESSEINLPPYLAKALVYYVKAKLQEDIGKMDLSEYFMKEFKSMLEKHENSKVAGPRILMPGANAIR